MIRWLSMREAAVACGFKDARTFKVNYIEKYPPDRTQGNKKWWKETTIESIKQKEFGVVIDSDLKTT